VGQPKLVSGQGENTMAKTSIDEFFFNLYKMEFERKDKNDSIDTFLLTLVTVLGSVTFFVVKLLPFEEAHFLVVNAVAAGAVGFYFAKRDDAKKFDHILLIFFAFVPGLVVYYIFNDRSQPAFWPKCVFVGFFGAFLGFYLAATMSVVGSVFPKYVDNLASADSWRHFLDQYQVHLDFGNHQLDEFEKVIEPEFLRATRVKLSESASRNREFNLIKQKWQSRARYFVGYAVFATIINAVPSFYLMHYKKADVQQFEIVNPTGANNGNPQPAPVGRPDEPKAAGAA
jgi:hypothetical protein